MVGFSWGLQTSGRWRIAQGTHLVPGAAPPQGAAAEAIYDRAGQRATGAIAASTRTCSSVAVMDIGIVGMRMHKSRVVMNVLMRLLAVPVGAVRMLMM